MASAIDSRYPEFGNPTTMSVRINFERAQREISDLQATLASLGGITSITTTGNLTGGGTGNVTLSMVDAPVFGGIPTAPTAPLGVATTQLATTQFVMRAVENVIGGGGGITAIVAGSNITASGTGSVTIGVAAAPTFTGVVRAASPEVGANDTQVATTQWVTSALSGFTPGGGGGGVEQITQGSNVTVSGTTNVTIGVVAAPTFTGVVTAGHPGAGANNAQLATTQWVQGAIAGLSPGGGGGLPMTGGNLTGPLSINLGPATLQSLTGGVFQLMGPTSGSDAHTAMAIDATGVPNLRLRRTGGDPPTALANAAQVGQIYIQGWDGAKFAGGCYIQAITTQPWNTSNSGVRTEFWSTPDNANQPTRAFYIGNRGGLLVGNPSAAGSITGGSLSIENDLYVWGTIYHEGEPITGLIAQLMEREEALEQRVASLLQSVQRIERRGA